MGDRELLKYISKKTGMDGQVIETVISCLFEYVLENIRKNGICRIRTFGTFHLKSQKAHRIRNVSTNRTDHTKPSCSMGFKVSETLKKKLNGDGKNEK